MAGKDAADDRRSKSELDADSREADAAAEDGTSPGEAKGADSDHSGAEGEKPGDDGPVRCPPLLIAARARTAPALLTALACAQVRLRLVEARRLQGGDVEEAAGPITYFVRTQPGAVTSADGAGGGEGGGARRPALFLSPPCPTAQI